MKRFIKYGVVPVVTFLFLLIATVIVLPVVINVQKYLPQIEKKLTNTVGRPVSIGSNFGLSFFPWLSITFSDLKIDNPKGYLSKEFIKIESFEARVKLLPLLKKEVQISRFIVSGLEVNLEKRTDGRVNWDFSQENSTAKISGAPFFSMTDWFLNKDLTVGLFAVTDGTVMWLDRTRKPKESRFRIDELMLLLNNFTLNEPVASEFKATIDGKSFAAEGTLGPLGQYAGKGAVPVDMAINLRNVFSGKLKGKFSNVFDNPIYDIELHIPAFSGRKLLTTLTIDLPTIITTDPTAFHSIAIDIAAKGDKEKISIEKGQMKIDDTLINMSLTIEDFNHPDLGFAVDIDRLDLDRYLTPVGGNSNKQGSKIQSDPGMKDDNGWRNMKLTGILQIKEMAVAGGTIGDIDLHLRGSDGILTVDPSSFTLYQGRAQTNLTINFQDDIPQTSIDLNMQGVDAGPFVHDFWARNFLTGTLDTDVRLQFAGQNAHTIQTSLNANGTLLIKDGTFSGIDMVHAQKNIVDSPSGSDLSAGKNRTDFSQLKSVFTVKNGLFESRETSMKSPAAGIVISGTADLVSQELRLTVNPKSLVLTLEEQGADNSDASIPFALSGTIAKPKVDIAAQYLSLDELRQPEELNVQSLVDEKLPSPADADVKGIIGTALIDPAVVARRFGLQTEVIHKNQEKKQLQLGKGRVYINPIQEKDSRH